MLITFVEEGYTIIAYLLTQSKKSVGNLFSTLPWHNMMTTIEKSASLSIGYKH